MTAPWEDTDRRPKPVADPVTGEIRLCSRKCDTCVLNPAESRIALSNKRITKFVNGARAKKTHVICHQTLEDGMDGAMCRGYLDAYGLPPMVLAAVAVGGLLVEVDPPDKEKDA